MSPGTIRMKCFRILPDIWARTLRWPGRSTRNIVPGNTCVTVPSVTICPSFDIAWIILLNASRSNWRDRESPILSDLIKRHRGEIFSKFLALPPCSGLSMFARGRETVAIKHSADVARRFVREWILREQPAHIS